MTDASLAHQLAQVVIRGLAAGKTVEIDELGVFYPDPDHGLRFEPRLLPQVFVAYVKEDRAMAEQLYDALEAAGFGSWMDVRKLLPGQNWRRAIENAIEDADFFRRLLFQHLRQKERRLPGRDSSRARLRPRRPPGRNFRGARTPGRMPGTAIHPAGIAIHRSLPQLAAGHPSPDRHDAPRSRPANRRPIVLESREQHLSGRSAAW